MSVARIMNTCRVPLHSVDQNDVRNLVEWPTSGIALQTCDVQTNRFFKRQLEYFIPELVDFEHAPISARTILPIDRRAGSGAQIITWRQKTAVGQAKVMSDFGDDVPNASVFAEEFTSSVRSLACEATWSLQEIRAAAMANVPLEIEEGEAAREAILRLENSIAWNGDSKHKLVGVIDTPNIPTAVAPGGVWSGKTAAQKIADLHLLVNSIFEDTNQVERANKVLMPTEQYHLAVTENAGTGTDLSVLEYFVRNSPYINSTSDVIPLNEMKGAGAGGVDIMIAFDMNMAKISMQVPFDLESLAPEVRGMTTNVIYHERFGGVIVKKPLSLNILTTI